MAKKKVTLDPETTVNIQPPPEAAPPTVAPLDTLLPDPGQPRRLLPDDLAEAVMTGSLSPIEALQAWLRRADSPTVEPGLRRNVRELKRLAGSIAQHGLISPISVRPPQPDENVPPGITYFIVTGERRYWAHVYLRGQGQQIQAGQTTADPAEIKISLAPPGVTIRAHQLIENLLREDLNAIERARGMWALRYELSGLVSSQGQLEAETAELNESSAISPRVNYSSPSLVPWARVEESLNISKRYRIFIIAVLQLSQAAQALIASHNLAEMTIRPISQKLKDKPDLQLKALQQLIAWQTGEEEDAGPDQSIVASVKELVDQLLIEAATPNTSQMESAPSKRSRSISSAPVTRFRDKVRQTLDFLNRLKKPDRIELTKALYYDDYADVRLDLRNLRQQIDAILNSLPQSLEPTTAISPLETLSDPAEASSTESDVSPQES